MWRSVTSYSADLACRTCKFHSISVDPAGCDFVPAQHSRNDTGRCLALALHTAKSFYEFCFCHFSISRGRKKNVGFQFSLLLNHFPIAPLALSHFFYFARRSLSCPDWLCNIRSVDELLMRSHFSTLHRRNMNAVVGEIRTELVPSIIKFPTSKRSSLSRIHSARRLVQSPTYTSSIRLISTRRYTQRRERELFFFSSLLSSASLVSELPEWKKIHQIGVENHILTKLSKSVEHRARNEKVAKILIRVIINSLLVEI